MEELKEYVVCTEIINGKSCGYTIRINTDCNPVRFRVIASFDTFEEADHYVHCLKD